MKHKGFYCSTMGRRLYVTSCLTGVEIGNSERVHFVGVDFSRQL